MKIFFTFIFNAIAQYIIQIVFVLFIAWLGLPILLPEFQKYSWVLLGNIFSTEITIGHLLLVITPLIVVYFLINKLYLKQPKLIKHNNLLWKVNIKTKTISKMPYCPSHSTKLISRYIPDNDYPYTKYYCPICNNASIPDVNSFNIDNLYEEAESVLLSKYEK
jgi:hypothetical protein